MTNVRMTERDMLNRDAKHMLALKKTSKIHTCPLLSIDTYVLTDKNIP